MFCIEKKHCSKKYIVLRQLGVTKNPSERSPWWSMSLIIEVGDDGTANGTSSFWRYPGDCGTTCYLWIIFQDGDTSSVPPQMWMAKPDALNRLRVEKSQRTMSEGGYGTWRHRLRPKRAVERSLKLETMQLSAYRLTDLHDVMAKSRCIYIYIYISVVSWPLPGTPTTYTPWWGTPDMCPSKRLTVDLHSLGTYLQDHPSS